MIIIKEQEKDKCTLCGRIEELRPYGVNGNSICFECGMLNVKETEKQMGTRLFKINYLPN